FAGTESAVSERTDYSYGGVNETILSGDFNGDDVITGEGETLSITGNSENVYHVIYHPEGYILTSTALLDGFTVTGGNANGGSNPYDDAGGIYNSDGQNPTINNCYFIGNVASDNGGAIQTIDNASPISISNSVFKQNKAGDSGGAINFTRGPGTVTNCFFIGNKATNDYGGAVYVWQSSANIEFINSTMTENNATSGGAIHIDDHAEGTFINCIAYGNTITTGNGPQIRVFDNATANISYTDIEGGIGTGATANSNSTINDNGNNIDSDPLFVGSTLNPQYPYAILRTSPCADAGDNAANSETYDIRGSGFERKLNKTDGSSGTIDMGAYEYNLIEDLFDPNILFVNDDAPGNNSGISWKHAYTSFQTALETASSGQQIWVAKGLYKPSKETDGNTDSPNAFTFRMIEGVEIYGGFAGTETETSVRTNYGLGETNETILSGDLNGDDEVTGSGSTLLFENNSDNTYNVFNHNSYTLTNSAVLDGFTIKGGYQTAYDGAGMVNGFNSDPTIRNCVFTENLARSGAAIYNNGNTSVFDNCSFIKNKALSGSGGAISNNASPNTISNSIFIGNYAFSNGGGISLYNANSTIKNCLFYNNYGRSKGGAISHWDSSSEIVNVTITENSSTAGGGIYLQGDEDAPNLKNAIVWNNSANSGDQIYNFAPLVFTITNCDIEGSNGSGGSWDTTIGVDGGNNIDFEPYFVGTTENPDHPYAIFGNSPCVDAGDNTANAETYDIRGSGFDRKLDGTDGSAGTIDMGAYEYKYGTDPESPSLLYVDVDASAGKNTGLSWTDAFTSLQDALDIAASGGEIWVAAGTYHPSQETDGSTDTPAEFAFQLIEGVEIYGGFAGTESNVSERTDYGLSGTNETILSGDLNEDDLVTGSGSSLSFSNTSDNTYQVFKHPNNYTLTSSAVLDGFTIKGAHNTTLYGGGILNSFGAEPAIRNCVFTENFAKYGGGMASSISSPNVLNCTFTRNKASFDGGALYVQSSASSGVVSGLTIYGNYAGNGGGIFSSTSSEQYFNCLIYDNASLYDGAGVYISNGSPAFVNLTITMNEAGRNGGGIFTVLSVQTPELANSIVWGNDASTGDDIHHHNDKLLGISYSTIKNSGGSDSWSSNYGIDGGNNIDENPVFYDDINDDFRIISNSPCTDVGDNSANNQSNDVRGVGYDRILNSTIDMGAYEYNSGTDPEYALAVWSGAMNNNWATYGNWLNNSAPGPYHNVVIPDEANDPIINNTDAATINNLTIESGASLTLESWSNGTASLIVNGTVTNNGTFETECFLWELGWHLVSPSTTGITANDFSWNDDPMTWLTSHSEVTNGWTYNTDLTTSMPMGQGWSVWVDDNEPADFKVASMIGSMRLTNLIVSLSYSGSGVEQGWNLLGNPFTSALDWDEGSWGVNTTGTVYVWDNDYNSGDFRSWNGTIGDLTDGIIPISQGFFVKATSEGNFTIPTNARVHSSTVFYKSGEQENESPYVRLQMEYGDHGNTVFVGFPEHGTSGFDHRGDADKLISSADLPQIFVTENDRRLCINALEPLSAEQKSVPLFLTQVINGEYTFTMTQLENLPDVSIELEDLKTGSFQDMKNNPVYTFTANEGDDEARFLLHFKSLTFGIDDPVQIANGNISIYAMNNRLYIESKANTANESGRLEVFTMTGQKVLDNKIPAGSLISVPVNSIAGNYIIVRVIKASEIKTEKIFIK
ncbi:MAG: right-handed parallel beta-helix repeat-containing protein, partial [Bacteroidetes bacterium]|nr:right-handed parallel beta-helix repeat-containing protein [Bacteroidota bacterium]MBU1578980.1 right-handed parallel beta-helix repeat-containing protein [Bacteroidota bacterium]